MHLFYSASWSAQDFFSLSEEESRHCVQVLRHKTGDEIRVIDGKGNVLVCKIVLASPKTVQLQYVKTEESKQIPSRLHIAISPTKSNDRIEWFLEKACEIGVGKITPVLCQRTERSKINIERWQKIIIAACKQAQVLYFPVVENPISLYKFLQDHSENTMVASIQSKQHLSHVTNKNMKTILIGPEGDFSEEEFANMRELGLAEVSLSNNILRVETAGIVAASIWNSQNG